MNTCVLPSGVPLAPNTLRAASISTRSDSSASTVKQVESQQTSADGLLVRLQRLCSALEYRQDLVSGGVLPNEIVHHVRGLEKWLDAPISTSREFDENELFEDEPNGQVSFLGEQSLNLSQGPFPGKVEQAQLPIRAEPDANQMTPASSPLALHSDSHAYQSIYPAGASTTVEPDKSEPGVCNGGALCKSTELFDRVMAAAKAYKENYERIVNFNDRLVSRIDKFSSDSMEQKSESDRLKHTVQFQRTELLCLKLQVECYENGFGEHPYGFQEGPLPLGESIASLNSQSRLQLQLPKIVAPQSPLARSPSPSPACPPLSGGLSVRRTPSPNPVSAGMQGDIPVVTPRRKQGKGGGHGRSETMWYCGRSTSGEEVPSAGAAGIEPAGRLARPVFSGRRTASVDNPNFPYVDIRSPVSAAMLSSVGEVEERKEAGAAFEVGSVGRVQISSGDTSTAGEMEGEVIEDPFGNGFASFCVEEEWEEEGDEGNCADGSASGNGGCGKGGGESEGDAVLSDSSGWWPNMLPVNRGRGRDGQAEAEAEANGAGGEGAVERGLSDNESMLEGTYLGGSSPPPVRARAAELSFGDGAGGAAGWWREEEGVSRVSLPAFPRPGSPPGLPAGQGQQARRQTQAQLPVPVPTDEESAESGLIWDLPREYVLGAGFRAAQTSPVRLGGAGGAGGAGGRVDGEGWGWLGSAPAGAAGAGRAESVSGEEEGGEEEEDEEEDELSEEEESLVEEGLVYGGGEGEERPTPFRRLLDSWLQLSGMGSDL